MPHTAIATRKLPIESQPLPKSQYRSVLQASCNIAIDAFIETPALRKNCLAVAATLPPSALETLYAARETKNRGCGGHMMPCHWADQLIAEAIGRGWRPDGGAVDTTGPFSSEDYRLADMFKWPLHFGPKALPLLRWRDSIGSALHAATAKPRDSAALRSVVSAHTGCSGEPPPPPRSCAVHLRLGDVMERATTQNRGVEISVDDLWNKAQRRGYVFPRCYYESAIRKLRASSRRVDTVVIVGNPRSVAYGRAWRANNSEAYVQRVADLFAAEGYAIERRTSSSADCDLVFLAKSSCLIPGGGGFSALAAELAREAVVEGDPQCRSSN